MKSRTKTKGLYNIVSSKANLYSNPQVEIQGWHRFCSGAIVSGIGGRVRTASRNDKVKRDVLDKLLVRYRGDFEPLNRIQKFKDMQKDQIGNTHFDLPLEYHYAWVLEQLFLKARDGYGGQNMWGNNTYPSKTFVMGDRTRDRDRDFGEIRNPCVMGFAEHIGRRLAHKFICRMVRLTDVEGAHGGSCSSWLMTLNLTHCQSYLTVVRKRLNRHLKYIEEYRENLLTQSKYKGDVAELTEMEEIAHYW